MVNCLSSSEIFCIYVTLVVTRVKRLPKGKMYLVLGFKDDTGMTEETGIKDEERGKGWHEVFFTERTRKNSYGSPKQD